MISVRSLCDRQFPTLPGRYQPSTIGVRDLTPFCGPKGRKMEGRSYVRMARRDEPCESPGCHLRQEACLFYVITLLFLLHAQKNTRRQMISVRSLCDRQFPTLPGRYQPSTIGVKRLNFCVRDGNRCVTLAIVTGRTRLHIQSLGQVFDRLVSLSYIHCCTST